MRKVLSPKFFNRKTTDIARDLLGKFLVVRDKGRLISAMITEVEAYDGFDDKASHASRGRTIRNAPMFGEAGHWYVYFCYGMYWMLNIVTGPKDYPAAVLIRGVACKPDTFFAAPIEAGRRFRIAGPRREKKVSGLNRKTLNGPGKLTKYLGIDKRFNGKKADKKTGLWIEDWGVRIGIKPFGKLRARKSPRVGVDYAGPIWSKKHYRFWVDPAPLEDHASHIFSLSN